MQTLMQKIRHVRSRIGAYRNWYSLVWPLTRMLPVSRVIATRDGIRIRVRSILGEDFVVVHEMYSRDDYQLRTITLPQMPTTIIDAGANIGVFSLLAARLFPQAHVLALEPGRENFALLQENIRLNNLDGQVIPLEVGISDVRGTYDFFISKEQYAHSLVKSLVADTFAEKVTISCVTLADLFTQNNIDSVGVLKLDIEGTEYELLLSIAEFFPRIINIVLEIHDRPGFSAVDLLAYMKKHGYEIVLSPTHQKVYLLRGPGHK